MASTPESRGPLSSEPDEKGHDVQREYLAQDESPNVLEAKKKEDALRRKLDCYVAPVSQRLLQDEINTNSRIQVMMMLMLISYLDRGNIGFAATQGMTVDINLKGSELNVSSELN